MPRRRSTIAASLTVAVMFAACLLTLPWTAGTTDAGPRRYEAGDPGRSLLPPSWAAGRADEQARADAWEQTHGRPPRPLLGTDRAGRDLFVRCLVGGGVSLVVGLSAAIIAAAVGTIYGTIAGAAGGRVDAILMRIVDILFGLPYILLVVLLAVAVDGLIERAHLRAIGQPSAPAWLEFVRSHRGLVNLATLLVAIGGVSWLTMARVIRGQVLSLKQQPFMEACRAMGVPAHRQFLHHLLPNLMGPVIVYTTLAVPQAILSESFLSFLGIGVREPLPSWGNLAADGLGELNTVRVRWWLLLFPCLLIAATLLALSFVGEGLRDRLDPRLGRGRSTT